MDSVKVTLLHSNVDGPAKRGEFRLQKEKFSWGREGIGTAGYSGIVDTIGKIILQNSLKIVWLFILTISFSPPAIACRL